MMAVSVRIRTDAHDRPASDVVSRPLPARKLLVRVRRDPKSKEFLMVAVDEPTRPRLAVAMDFLPAAGR